MNNHAIVLLKLDPEKARELYEDAYKVFETQSETHPNTLKAMFNLAFALSSDLLADLDSSVEICLNEEDYKRAEGLFIACYKGYIKLHDDFFHPDTSNVRATLVKFYSRKGNWRDAIPYLNEIVVKIEGRVKNCKRQVKNSGDKDEQDIFELDMRLSMYDVHVSKGELLVEQGDFSLSFHAIHLHRHLIADNLCWITDDFPLHDVSHRGDFPSSIADFLSDDDRCIQESERVPEEPPILPNQNDEDDARECMEELKSLFEDGALETKETLLADSEYQFNNETQENVVESWIDGFVKREMSYWEENEEEAVTKRAELDARSSLISEWREHLKDEKKQAELLSNRNDLDSELLTGRSLAIRNFNERMDKVGVFMITIAPCPLHSSFHYSSQLCYQVPEIMKEKEHEIAGLEDTVSQKEKELSDGQRKLAIKAIALAKVIPFVLSL